MARVIAIVTLYYPQIIHKKNIEKIASQSDLVALCDNSPFSNEAVYAYINNARYYYNGVNNGLSKAFNFALKDIELNWTDDDFVIFFDQDSQIPLHHIERLREEYERLKKKGVNVGCIGPVYYDTSVGKEMLPRKFTRLNNQTMSVRSIVTTSMLMKYRDLQRINYWNEEVFLDLADWDMCWRLAAMNFKICLTTVSIIRHSVGLGNKKIGPFFLRIGNPFREYYQIRDGLYLMSNKYTPLYFRIRFIVALVFRPILHLLFLDAKRKRLKYILKGVCDYSKGITGPL